MDYGMFGMDSSTDQSTEEDARLSRQDQGSDIANLEGAPGSGASFPVQTDTTSQFTPTLTQMLGSAPTVARDVGTAIGNTQRQLGSLGGIFSSARSNAASGNGLATWWAYASTTDKLMVGLAVVGILVALRGEL